MFTAENTSTTARYFGRCSVNGCKHRRVIQVDSAPQLVTMRGEGGQALLGIGGPGIPPGWELPVTFTAFTGGPRWVDAMKEAGLACAKHPNKVLRFERLRGTFNAEKTCTGRCMGATGPACDCQCGGENHGLNSVG